MTRSSSAKQNGKAKGDPSKSQESPDVADNEEVEKTVEKTEENEGKEEQNEGGDDNGEEAPAPATPSEGQPPMPHQVPIQPHPYYPPYGYPYGYPMPPGAPPPDYLSGTTSPHVYTDAASMGDPAPDTRRNRGGVTEPFPERLHRMLDSTESEGLADVVSFFSHGRAFAIHKPRRFVAEIMPRFFRQTKLTSFQRQLNLYGFRRISQGPDNGGYYHELFLKGRPGLCVNMKRVKIKGDSKIKRDPDTEPNFYIMRPVLGSPPPGGNPASAPGAPQASPGSTSGTPAPASGGPAPFPSPTAYPPPPYGYPGYQFPNAPPYTAAQTGNAPMYPYPPYYMYPPGAWGVPPGGYPPQSSTATTPQKGEGEGETSTPAPEQEGTPATGGDDVEKESEAV